MRAGSTGVGLRHEAVQSNSRAEAARFPGLALGDMPAAVVIVMISGLRSSCCSGYCTSDVLPRRTSFRLRHERDPNASPMSWKSLPRSLLATLCPLILSRILPRVAHESGASRSLAGRDKLRTAAAASEAPDARARRRVVDGGKQVGRGDRVLGRESGRLVAAAVDKTAFRPAAGQHAGETAGP